jgi:F0F1-type ATP synthase membrane subunit b/b'
MNFFKEEIDQLGDKLQITVKHASAELNEVVAQAGKGLEQVVLTASEELAKQRSLTKTDMQELIQFAVQEVEQSLDAVLVKAKQDVSEILSAKIIQVRNSIVICLVIIFIAAAVIRII